MWLDVYRVESMFVSGRLVFNNGRLVLLYVYDGGCVSVFFGGVMVVRLSLGLGILGLIVFGLRFVVGRLFVKIDYFDGKMMG